MIGYLAHPVGHGEDREENIANVQAWFLWLFKHTDLALNVPWFIYVTNLSEEHRDRALKHDLEILNTCNAIILTGGRVSPGMATELMLALAGGLRMYDLTGLGYAPPEPGSEQEQKALEILRGL